MRMSLVRMRTLARVRRSRQNVNESDQDETLEGLSQRDARHRHNGLCRHLRDEYETSAHGQRWHCKPA